MVIGSDQVDIWTNSGVTEFSSNHNVLGVLNSQKIIVDTSSYLDIFLGGGDDQVFLKENGDSGRTVQNRIALGDGDDELHLWGPSGLAPDNNIWSGSGRDSIYIYAASEILGSPQNVTIQDFTNLDEVYLESQLDYTIVSTGADSYLNVGIQANYIYFQDYQLSEADISRFSYDTEVF